MGDECRHFLHSHYDTSTTYDAQNVPTKRIANYFPFLACPPFYVRPHLRGV